MEKETKSVERKDGWLNLFTGLGTKADKTKSTRVVPTGFLTDAEKEIIYADDGLGARIVDLLPEDMMKQGWHYVFENEKEGFDNYTKIYNHIFKEIRANYKIALALKWARLYGGALILLGVYDGESLDQPLNLNKIKNFENLKIIPRNNVMYGTMEFQMNPELPHYGQVEYYPVTFYTGRQYQMQRVHYSRVIELKGVEIPSSEASLIPMEFRYWGLSVFQRIQDRLKELGSSFSSLANLLNELTIGKYKYKDLAMIMASADGGEQVQKRLQAMDLMKSVFHSVLLDTDESFERDTLSFGGVSDVMYQFMMMTSAATGYPMTKLFGISPGGLNSTGEADMYQYYDMVKAKQETELLPIIERLVKIISEWQKIPEPEIAFNPLEQMTEKEQAELEEKKADSEYKKMQTYQGYIDMGIMSPEIVEELEFGDTLQKIEKKNEKKESELPPVSEEE
jgi:phage-related protein (TIGR01555 family)